MKHYEMVIKHVEYQDVIRWCHANITSWTMRHAYIIDEMIEYHVLVVTDEEEYVHAVLRWG